MADRNKKDSTPPPLLLMPAGGGLTLNPSAGSSLLMPVAQSEASLLSPEEEGEADSFVGQAPPMQAPVSGGYFQIPPQGAMADPFSQVCQPAPGAIGTPPKQTPFGTPQQQTPFTTPQQQTPYSTPQSAPPSAPVGVNVPPPGPLGPPVGVPPPGTDTPPRGPSNFHRMQGTPRYAQPPPGTYGPSQGQGLPLGPPTSIGPPPTSIGPPPTSIGLPPAPLGISSPQSQDMSHVGVSPTSFNPVSSPPGPTPGSPPTLPVTSPGVIPGGYTPMQHHWCYCTNVELKSVWHPLSQRDSAQLEEAFRSGVPPNHYVSVEGGRYDVDVAHRQRRAIYWEEEPTHVRRCSWFYKNEGDNRYVPYDEQFADRLEDEYRNAVLNNIWHKRLEFPGGETIVMHNPNVIVHFSSSAQPDEWGTTQVGLSQGDATRPKVVKRGIEDFDFIDEGEPSQVDHVVFVVHGIGSTCDLRFRNIVECGEPLNVDHIVFVVHGIGAESEGWTPGIVRCVNDFRTISFQILKSHFGQHQKDGRIGRVEFLPVRWHAALHGDATGIDRRLKAITLKSIGKLRHFTNDTLLDILFYASPAYCQQIVDTVCSEIGRLHQLFLSRNPEFKGSMSVAGHSLGSLILFDLLSHQNDTEDPTPEQNGSPEPASKESTPLSDTPVKDLTNGVSEEEEAQEDDLTLDQLLEQLGLGDFTDTFKKEQIDMESLSLCDESDIKEMGLPMGPRKKLQGYLKERKQRQAQKKETASRKAQEEMERKAQEQAEQQANEQKQLDLHHAAVNGSSGSNSDPLLKSASSTSVNYVVGGNGTGAPHIHYPKLPFQPANFFALGSPVAMFLAVRGVDMLGEEFRLPTCMGFFNIFHPFDPVAYRVEPLISQTYPVKPTLMPHHKGRKRMHLELKESLTRMGADIKQKIMASLKGTWATINQFAQAHRASPQEVVDQEVDSMLSQMSNEEDERAETGSIASSMPEDDMPIGQLNQGRRIDYVLQEKPIESFNDYLFALGSHACYWESEDTVLMVLKEIYAMMGISPKRPGQDKELGSPQRGPFLPSPGAPPSVYSHPVGLSPPGLVSPPGAKMPPPPMSYGQSPMPPTSSAPPSNYGPPPLSGFVRK